jgi:hypothetical protein
MLGRGGKHAMTRADRKIVKQLLKEQETYLRAFTRAVERAIHNGELSRDQIAHRASLYFDSTRYAHERAKGESWGVGRDLPGYPCDGGTECLGRCNCHWSFRETKKQIKATWRLTPGSKTCAGCGTRASEWAPFVIEKVAG